MTRKAALRHPDDPHVAGAGPRIALAATLLAISGLTGPAAAGETAVAYPEGYRHWTHVKSMVIEDGHPLFESFGGLHHLYANDAALEGYATGSFPDGAVIVFDLLEALRAEGALTEGPRKVLGVMVRDSAAHAATGGWGYEAWAGGDPSQPPVGAAAAEACHACHVAAEETGFVFSRYRD